MPSCLRQANIGSAANTVTYLYDVGGGPMVPQTRALVLVPDTVVSDLSQCASVSISGAEYLALKSGSGSSGTVQTPTPQNWLELGNMSVADAQSTSVYIGLLWATVWGFKQIARSLINRERDVDE